MENLFGDSNVQYLIPEVHLRAYTHVNDNVCIDGITEGSQIAFGCCCDESTCFDDGCACIAEGNSNYTQHGMLTFIDNIIVDPHFTRAVFECNDVCTCALSCPNRVVQRGLAFKLKVVQTRDRGYGVEVLQEIFKGNYVIDYAGEVLSAQEALQRMKVKENGQCNYLLTVREIFGEKQVTTFIDAAKFGNVSRFINHSCEPNLILHPVRVNSSVPRLALFARHDIQIGEELSFDYGGGNSVEKWDNVQERIPCRCGSTFCKGFLPVEPLNDVVST